MSASNPLALNFELHAKQGLALISNATELLYGGAASGGKSHLSRVMSILWAIEIPGIQIYLFRRLYDDLVKNHVEGPTGFRSMLSAWINTKHPKSPLTGGKLAEVVEGEIRFWNGSKIFLCHCQHEKDLIKYQGPEFHVLFLEEATQFTEYMIRFLRSRMRIPDKLQIPEKYKGLFPRVIYTANPGGIGHRYMKEGFIKGKKPFEYYRAPDDDGGHVRQFIPAKVDDNPSVDREKVKQNLSGLPPALVDAMLNGNWDAVVGAFFPEFERKVHLVPPHSIPAWWPRMCAMDWGAAGDGDPWSIGWFTVSDGSLPKYPKDALIMYRHWYGRGSPKITAHKIAEGIIARERGETIDSRVAGGDIIEKRGHGESIFEIFANAGVYFRRADMRRVSGWQQVRERLVGKHDTPLIYFFDTYEADVETIMTLQFNPHDPNDCAPGEDHVADMVRYMCMARPWSRAKPKDDVPLPEKFSPPTVNDLWAIRDQQMGGRRR